MEKTGLETDSHYDECSCAERRPRYGAGHDSRDALVGQKGSLLNRLKSHKLLTLRSARWLMLCVMLCGLPAPMQSQGNTAQPTTGSISGTVVDATGGAIVGAQVKLLRDENSPERETLSSNDGKFSFADVTGGPYSLTVVAQGFAPRTLSGNLRAGEAFELPPIALVLSIVTADVQVTLTQTELAQEQIKAQEKQRILGILPNYYVSYLPDAAPLTAKQKFELAWKTTLDPVSFGVTGAVAGVQQSRNTFSGYGQGGLGYARRYGAAYADLVTGTVIGGAVLPSLLRQDPRYFYKGTGSTRSRIFYALTRSVISKGDNGRWQPAYAGLLGDFAASGVSNIYYPAKDRNGLSLTVENALIGIGGDSAGNLLQEFVSGK